MWSRSLGIMLLLAIFLEESLIPGHLTSPPHLTPGLGVCALQSQLTAMPDVRAGHTRVYSPEKPCKCKGATWTRQRPREAQLCHHFANSPQNSLLHQRNYNTRTGRPLLRAVCLPVATFTALSDPSFCFL